MTQSNSFTTSTRSKRSTRPELKVAAIQLNSQQDIEQNLTTIAAGVAAASDKGADLVVLPENMCSMGRQHETAERFDDLSAQIADLAAKHQTHLVAGTLPCLYRPDGTTISDGRLRQVSQLFGPDGQQIARYDKIHLFTATVSDDTGSYNEAATFEPGTQTVVAPITIDNSTYQLGMMVCFDLRFPALAQQLRQVGAELLTAPSAFTYMTGQAHWQLLLRARALDSQCMVIGAPQGGHHHYQDSSVRQTWGHAAISRHDGVCVDEYTHSDLNVETNADKDMAFATVMATFDPEAQRLARQQLPIFQCHRLA
ncbi:nitrilase-related carbon-nitrogen hydrolase [Psychrobacter pygoscelis]|uniref:nitrilase-related carbon-nitrogen hydrolase n=1 Tax=Psychrobacter pygoscelis TaxID=2488563 RepID=UPI001039835A|nr:nitrilase-related carbon-nitrogen hydrolase [Psychrobacter pygoscelis]